MGRSEMFVLKMGVNQSRVFAQLSYYHHLPSVPPGGCSLTSLQLHFLSVLRRVIPVVLVQ